jgi:hypothetical protein
MSEGRSDTLVFVRDVILSRLFRMLATLAMKLPARMHGVSRRDERRKQIDTCASSPRVWHDPRAAEKR